MAEDATSGAAAGGEAGIPQLAFETFPNQIFWLVVTLVAIYFILTRIALPRIASVLAERQGTLTNDLAAAEDLKRQAVEAEAAYNKALAEARAEAQKIAEETRAVIQADLDRAIERADAEIAARSAESAARIESIHAGALTSVEEIARSISGDVVAAVAPGQSVDAEALSAAIASRVKG